MKYEKHHIIKSLLEGMYLMKRVNHHGDPGYKMYSGNMVPELFIPEYLIKSMLLDEYDGLFKKSRTGRLSLNLKEVRKLHGNDLIKKLYKKHIKNRKKIN